MDALGDRMKKYEDVNRSFLTRRIPVILRLDGRAFHTVARKYFEKGYNEYFVSLMTQTAKAVQKEIQGCTFCFGQSDEISFILTDFKKITTEGWFQYNINKIISISASLASVKFSRLSDIDVCFDARCFNIPHDDVVNYFIWRQNDATRNAIQMLGRELFSQKELHNKSCDQIQEMTFQKGINFNDLPTHRKRGWCIVNQELDEDIPIFTQDRKFVESHVYIRED